MKTFGTFLLLLLLGAPAAAQSEPAPAGANGPAPAASAPETHGISVIKTNWQKRFYNPALDEDPLRGANDAIQLERARREAQRVNAIRQQQGLGRRRMPTQTVEGVLGGAESVNRDFYVYEVKVLNTGTKKIKSLAWDYVLFDPATQREVGRHSFETKTGIDRGKGKTLVGWSENPPAGIVDARKPEGGKKPDKESHAQFTERVDIQRVVYEDGAAWERPHPK
ncbi:MAG TPA: hypothetical protein VF591_16220 [Pyrinomonadaceae bacterium]|jgi:hypothetical protein